MGRRRKRNPLLRRALTAFERLTAERFGGVELGRVRRLGEGLSRRTFGVSFEVGEAMHHWVAMVPQRDTGSDDFQRFADEQELMGALAKLELPFRTSVPVGVVEVDGFPVHVGTWCLGLSAGDAPAEELAEVTAAIAASVHALPLDLPVPGQRYGTARDDVLGHLEDLEGPFVDDVAAFAESVADRPATVVHGDLLGQNVLVFGDHPPAVLDWEYAGIGDPARDLAIVTRGRRKVFGTTRGRKMLVDAYNAVAADPISPEALRLQELLLVAGQVRAFIERHPHSAEDQYRRVDSLLRRPLSR